MTVVVITTDAAHGTMTASRTNCRPGNALLSRFASASESTIVTMTTTDTHSTVRSSTPGRAGMSNRAL